MVAMVLIIGGKHLTCIPISTHIDLFSVIKLSPIAKTKAATKGKGELLFVWIFTICPLPTDLL